MVHEANPSEGVIIDLDIAARVGDDGKPVDGEALPPAGTLQFRAWELIGPAKPLKALYRHDLESFFWALLWIHLKHHTTRRPGETEFFPFDFLGTWDSTKMRRRGFFRRSSPSDAIPSGPLSDVWLRPLRSLFGNALLKQIVSPEAVDDETLGGVITFSNFVEVLQNS